MSTPRLNAYVHVRDEDGKSHAFGPDSIVPTWAIEAITNPDVWEIAPQAAEPKAPAVSSAPRKPGRPKKVGDE